ncbi:antitoxin VbhA family protein [Neisseria sp.]
MSLQIQEQHHLPQTTHSIIGSWRMEQLNISLKTIHDMQRLVEGKISLDEALDGIKQRMAEK